jgi:ABC-2 type transport system permease protein
LNTTFEKFTNGLRIILVIAAKDSLDAIKNKTLLAVSLGLVLMVLSTQVVPLLLKINPVPKAVVYDPGDAITLNEFKSSEQYEVRRSSSKQELEITLSEAPETMLGLLVPEDLDQRLAVNQDAQAYDPLEVTGLVMHWASFTEIRRLQLFFEQQLSELTGNPVRIQISENRVFPRADSDGQPFMTAMMLVLVILIMGCFLVPFLISEEKEKHTLEALLVSPASITQIITGKAMAGTLYSLVSGGVLLILYRLMVVHWGLTLLTAACGTLFAVGLGLLIGNLVNNSQTTMVVASAILTGLLLPVMLMVMAYSGWPDLFQIVLSWIPSVALVNLFRLSFSGDLPMGEIATSLGSVLGFSLLIYLLVVLKLQRLDR